MIDRPRRSLFALRSEVLSILTIIAVVVAAWCLAHGKLSPAAWTIPTTYLDAVYADFIGAAAWFKSLATGDSIPFGWKPVPELAAPASGGWDSFPSPEEVLNSFFALLIRTCGLFPGFNLGVLIGHVAAAITFYLVARRGFGVGMVWAFVGGLAFGLAPYQFAQQPHHIGCQYVWYLPLFPLVWNWIATGEDLSLGSRRFWQAMAIGFITGLQNPYYSNIFCQLVLVCGVIRAWQVRSWRVLKPVAWVIGAVAVAFLASNLDTLTYRVAHSADLGDSPLVAQREYRWMDIYGFKLVDLFIPPITHHSAALAKFGLEHRQASVLNDEEGSGYLGLLGIGCLFFLVSAAVRAMVEGRAKDVPIEAWWVLWIVIMFTTGGLNATIAAFTGFTLFRTAIRYSIVVLLLALLYAAQRMTGWHEKAAARMTPETLRIATLTAAIGGSLLVLWDQLPRTPTPQQVAVIADAVNSDRAFVAAMESALPPAAEGSKPMVFQLPVMEGLPIAGIPASHHYRPYLYSSQLHYSHGASGKTLDWQKAVQGQLFRGAEPDQERQAIRLFEENAGKAIDEIKARGFAAIYVNRNGFPDRGKGLREALAKLGYTNVIDSPAGDLMCVLLRKDG